PVILSATGGTEAAAGATVRFALDVQFSTYMVQFFANDAADPSGFGEGQRLLLSQQVRGQPRGTFTVHLPAVQAGTVITATATDGQQLDGNAETVAGDDYTFKFSYKSGDVTQDAVVNFADLLVLGQNYGKAATFAQGDLNHDGRVDFADLLILAQTYSQGSGT